MNARSILEIYYTDAGQKFPFKVRKVKSTSPDLALQSTISVGEIISVTGRAWPFKGLPCFGASNRSDGFEVLDSESYEFIKEQKIRICESDETAWTVYENDPEPGYFRCEVSEEHAHEEAIARSPKAARASAYEKLAATLRDEDRKERNLTPVAKWP